ncbi:DUF7144 family membrane protein [Thermomonospora umbrina]|uniref:DUF7144 domain-containing protein n=1 Tax=Thermomonospora umbrina TaxID=111806 RepID=A0A3D9SPJ0_9ACTN|nr:hypothetical protein [Thermomonospora umbrina]REE97828.1 hypothetical protein DFJ69_3303 [Thermomonospora umbrina]
MTTTPSTRTRRPTTSGWLTFAAVIIGVTGLFNAINGLVGIFDDDYYLVGETDVLVFNFTTWGWIWLLVGFVQIAVAAGISTGQTWARTAGIVLAILAAVGHLAFLAAFPWWSILTIGLSVLTIYALTVPPSGASAA